MSISLDDDKSRLLSENSMFWSLISSDCEKVSLKVEEEKARGGRWRIGERVKSFFVWRGRQI